MTNRASLHTALAALKNTPRTGWMLRGVPAAIAESIAAHSFESAVLALVIAEELSKKGHSVDPYLAASIALAHDLAEAYVGDIVKRATDAIGNETKEKIEITALEQELGRTSILTRLAREYIEKKSLEAEVAKVAETLSTLLQAARYMRTGYDVKEIACSMLRSLKRMSARGSEPAKTALIILEELNIKIECNKQ